MTKRNLTLLAAGALALAAASVENASAAVYFSDDFEGKTNPLDPPDIGIGYTAASATGNPFSISTPPAPAIGTGALKVIRESRVPPPNDNPGNLVVQGNEGALVDGAVVEFSWNNQIENTHSLNGPIQIGLGFVSGGVGRFTTVGVGDTGSSGANGAYNYINQLGTLVVATDLATGAVIRPSLNNGGAGQAQTAWDKMRVVITLDQFDADFMTGTMDYFITVGSTGVEHQVTNDEPVIFAEIADNDELTPYNDSTVPQITIQKGPFSGATYYDNIYIGDPAPIPEPSTLALGGVFGLLALRRARRRRC